jgi:hypothetical protein
MSAGPRTGHVLPNYRLPKLFGNLNILFSSQLLVCGLCLGVSVLSLPLLTRGMDQVQEKAARQFQARQKAEVEEAAQRLKEAKNDEEKGELEAKLKELEARPPAKLPAAVDFTKLGFGDSTYIAFSWVEVFSGIVLNILMLTSGIGLLECRGWALRLAIWTAAAKILRLLVLYSYFTVAIVPMIAQRMGAMVGDMMTQQPGIGAPGGVPPTEFLVRTYAITYSAYGIGMLLIGSIYPAAVLWFLTRPRVKAACTQTAKAKVPREPLET